MGNVEALEALKHEALANECTFVGRERSAGSSRYAFLCNSGHSFTATRSMLRRRGYWCPICSDGFQKYTEESARAFMLSVGLEPIEPYIGTRDPWKCKCLTCGIETSKRMRSIKQTGTKIGCQSCSMKARSFLQRTDEAVAIAIMLAANTKPLEPYKRSDARWKSLCLRCNNEIFPTLNNVKLGSDPCTYCSGHSVDEKQAIALCKEFGLEPIGSYPGNSIKWGMKCMKCGAEVTSLYGNITRKKRNGWKSFGCPECSFNEMGRRYSEDPEVARQKFRNANLEMIGEYKTARLPIQAKCLKCGATTKQTLNGVMNGKACKYCFHAGIKYGDPAYLYLIYHDEFRSIKVGISNVEANLNRLESHRKNGWAEYKSFNFDTADEAEYYETMLLKWLRKERGLPPHLVRELMPQGGFSETVDAEEISLPEIEIKLLALLQDRN
jgi:DNA-directed RNA polymerase subunit RPC12/RpoP